MGRKIGSCTLNFLFITLPANTSSYYSKVASFLILLTYQQSRKSYFFKNI